MRRVVLTSLLALLAVTSQCWRFGHPQQRHRLLKGISTAATEAITAAIGSAVADQAANQATTSSTSSTSTAAPTGFGRRPRYSTLPPPTFRPFVGSWIRAKDNGECLDSAGHDNTWKWVRTNARCSSTDPEFKWRLSGGNLRSGTPTALQTNNGTCVDCREQEQTTGECYVVVRRCEGNATRQGWKISVYPAQIDFGNRRVYFSIESLTSPSECLQRVSIRQAVHVPYTIRGFQLAPCAGTDTQSFYLDFVDFNDIFERYSSNPL